MMCTLTKNIKFIYTDSLKNVSIQSFSRISTEVSHKIINGNYYYCLKSKVKSTKTALHLTHKNDCDLDHKYDSSNG